MAKEGNTKKERIEKLEEGFASLTESVSNMEKEAEGRRTVFNDVYEWIRDVQPRIRNNAKITAYCGVIAIVSMILCVVLFIMIHRSNKEIDALQEEVQALQSTNVVSVVSTQPSATEEFVNAVFPVEDRIWYDRNGNTFYRDPDCKYAITSDPEFCSDDYFLGKDSSGNRIRVYRLTDGSFAYIPSNFSVYLGWPK